MAPTAVLGSQHKQLLLSGLHAAESVQGATGRRQLLSYVLTLPYRSHMKSAPTSQWSLLGELWGN